MWPTACVTWSTCGNGKCIWSWTPFFFLHLLQHINIVIGHTDLINKTVVLWGVFAFLNFFFPESITAVLLHVKKQGNKYSWKQSLEKQVTIAVNWDNTLVLVIYYSKSILIYAWLASSISTWPTKKICQGQNNPGPLANPVIIALYSLIITGPESTCSKFSLTGHSEWLIRVTQHECKHKQHSHSSSPSLESRHGTVSALPCLQLIQSL